MIISHKYKFIFIKTRKTAGTSLEIALSKVCGEDDIITPIGKQDEAIREKLLYRKPQNYLIPFSRYNLNDWINYFRNFKRKAFYNHMGAEEIRNLIDEDVWENYYKFCFERNPIDKVKSFFFFKQKRFSYQENFDTFINNNGAALSDFSKYYSSKEKRLLVDKVYKYENLEKAILDIEKVLGLEGEIDLKSIKAKSGFRFPNEKGKINTKTKEMIREIFLSEIEMFKYQDD